jgi:benzoyl-CoA 2,3-dioxygenase component A
MPPAVTSSTGDPVRQHLIDPEICIRCNTCEATCPVGAITHDDRNYVVDAQKCNGCLACIAPCPTGSIDNWRTLPRTRLYSVTEQFGWDELPPHVASDLPADPDPEPSQAPGWGATTPPWSAAQPVTNRYGPRGAAPLIRATVAGNVRVTAVGHDYDTHHLVLDFGATPFPLLEGQSIGIAPPGVDAAGRPHPPRQYSIASARNGERPGYNNASLTIKRVLEDHQGRPVRGLASNYLCDLRVGDAVDVIGPFGASFLMPNHPRSHIVMICTGTGSAPMRAMTEWRRRLQRGGTFEGGQLLLFFGARTPAELPYFGPLQNLPRDFIDINFAFSRIPGEPRRYVQDLMRERAAALAPLLADPDAYFYVCGLRAMERGVIDALREIAGQSGLAWEATAAALKRDGRLHLETY